MAMLMFLYFSAMCPLFFGMSMFGLYRKNRDRFKLVLCGVGAFMFVCARIAFHLTFDDLYPQAREAIFEIATGVMVANIWARGRSVAAGGRRSPAGPSASAG